MHADQTTLVTEDDDDTALARGAPERACALALVWSREEPGRAGELLMPSADGALVGFGRGGDGDDGLPRAFLVRQLPGANAMGPALSARRLSRVQWRLQALDSQRIAIDNAGRRALVVNGTETTHAVVQIGDVVEVQGTLVFLAVERPRRLPPALHFTPGDAEAVAAAPDRFGLVGESAAVWALRDLVAFVGAHDGHVLVHGPAGAGKELVARAVHAASARADGPLIARSAATIPEELADAEIFGHAAGYAGLGDEERPGLVGAAAGGTLLIDGLGAVPEGVAARLVRLMDTGEYHRLGDPTARRADVRVVVTSSAGPGAVPASLRGRFRHVLPVPALDERREDVPLIARWLLRQGLGDHPDLAARLLDERGEPRLSAGLVVEALKAPLARGVRDLDALLWRSIARSPAGVVEGPTVGRAARGAPLAAGQREVARAEEAEPSGLPPGLPESVLLGLPELTKSEHVVLQHLALNKTSKQIATTLFVSVRTVQNHRARICDKLGLRGSNRLLGVALALADHLGPPPSR